MKKLNYKSTSGQTIKKICLFICFIILWLTGETQTDITYLDSLKKILLKKNDDSNKVIMLIKIGDEYERNEINDEAITYYFNALKLSEKINDVKNQYKSLYAIADFYTHASDNEHALTYALKAQKIAEKINDQETLFQIYDLIGGFIYFNSGKYTETFDYGYKMMQIARAGNNTEKVLYMQQWFGDAYRMAKKFDSSLITYNMALQTATQLNNKEKIAGSLHGIGMAYINQGDYKNGLNYYLQSVNYSEKEGIFSGNYTYNTASAYMSFKKYDSALIYANASLTSYKKQKNKQLVMQLYKLLSTIYLNKKNYKEAYFNYTNFIQLKDSISSAQLQNKINTIQNNYNVEKQNNEIGLMQKQAKLQNILRNVIIVVLALVIAISILLANKYREKRKSATILSSKNDELIKTLTELKSTQAQLIQSEKMASLGELTAGIAHEIQNPLNFVNNFSEVNRELIEELKSQKSKLKSEEQDEILNDIDNNLEKVLQHGKRADAIVKGMLQHSRQSSGKKESTDINALCDEYLRLSYHGLRAKNKNFNTDFKTDFDESIGKINVVPQDIGRVLLNLFNNAFYAVNEKSQQLSANSYQPIVSIHTKRINDKIEIKVSDNGNGIPSNIIDKIFQPFFTTKPTGQGTGLGLSLAYDIITKEHNGAIKAESKEGEGSTFIIQLTS